MKDIINYIKTLSNNKKIQKLLIETIGIILSKQSDTNKIITENENKIIHIRDWISSVVENDEKWKTPRVLNIEALNNTADKYFEKKNNKIQTIELNESHEKMIADLGDYYIVQMLTPEALDNESKVMQHCVGHGGYDERLEIEEYQYLSLRDKYNKAHVTVEIYKKEILQLQGKQNKIPEDKYLEKLLPWLMNNNYTNIPWEDIGKYFENKKLINFDEIKVQENVDYNIIKYDENYELIQYTNEKTKYYFLNISSDHKINKLYFISNINKEIEKIIYNNYKQDIDKEIQFLEYLINDDYYIDIPLKKLNFVKINNKIYHINNIPDNIKIQTDLLLKKYDLTKLPNNMTIYGNIDILFCQNLKTLPNNLTIKGYLNLSQSYIKEIPEDIKIGKSLFLWNSKIEKLPNNLTINGDLILSDCYNLQEIPNKLTVTGVLNLLNNTNLKEIPNDLKCGYLYIDERHANLIDEKIDFKIISINGIINYSKNDFLEIYHNKIESNSRNLDV